MLIQILNVSKIPATTSKGQGYEQLDIAFKNLTFQGKVEGKKLTPFGEGKAAYDVLANAQSGQQYEVTVVKNNGYNNWTAASPSTGAGQGQTFSSPQTSAASSGYAYSPKQSGQVGSGYTANSRGFETPEERAAKQVYIVRQSSISAAVAALSVGSKSAPPAEAVIDYAKQLESFVFAKPEAVGSGFDDLIDDVPM